MKLLKKLMGKGCSSCATDKEDSAHVENDKSMRDNLSEKQTDKTVADSFPASDPASTY